MSWYPHIPTSQLSFYRQIPKVDLHQHLEGSLRVSTMLDIARQHGLEPVAHLTLGKALQEFGSENILVIGSGFSFHNMRAFSWQGDETPDPANDAFQNWLIETCAGSLPQAEREQRLVEWEKAPSARYYHPREKHLLPLHVCMGMAGRPAKLVFDDHILGKRGVAFLWSE